MTHTKKLAVIDDEMDLANFVSDVAEQLGFEVFQFNNASSFIQQNDNAVDVIVLDLMMPDVDGIEVIRFLADKKYTGQLILISGMDPGILHSAEQLATEHGLNFAGSLNKPFRFDEIDNTLRNLPITKQISNHQKHKFKPSVIELYQAINNNELCVFYQPKISLQQNNLYAVEALVRWQHPVHGLIYPDQFISTAEQNGLIDELTWKVITTCLLQCKKWLDHGLKMNIAINMSSRTLQELDLPEKIFAMVKQHGLQPSDISLEVTETALMQELTKSLDILTRLRIKGFQLSIDDFGTGFSSLVQLYRVAFSEIKIDRSFVKEMENDKEAQTIVETIILLGKKLNMKIVAEGIESESCMKKLAGLSCDQAQGFHIAKPMPADDVFAWYKNH